MRKHAVCMLIAGVMVSATARAESLRLIERFTAPNSEDGDFFGGSIDLLGRTLAVRSRNAYRDTRDSQIHVFQTGGSQPGAPWDSVANDTLVHPRQVSIGQDLAVQNERSLRPTVLIGLNQNSVNGVVGNGVVTTYTAADNRTDGVWTRQGDLAPSDLSPGAAFGRSIAVDEPSPFDSRLIVGASGNRTGLDLDTFRPDGAAFVYRRDRTTGEWTELAKLIADDLVGSLGIGPRFGTSVDISGNTAIVGAFADDFDGEVGPGRGSAYLFREDQNGEWGELQKLTVPGVGNFGVSVALHGDTALVLAAGTNELYVFQESQEDEQSTWNLTQTIGGGEGTRVWGGRSVAIDDGWLAVGFHDGQNGRVDVYSQNESNEWEFAEQLASPSQSDTDFFGFNVAINRGRVVVADPGSNPEFVPNFEAPIVGAPGEVFLFQPASGVAGDVNSDGVVDRLDYQIWHASFGSTTSLAADLNGNGVVDIADYTVWRDHLRIGSDPPSPAPEPSAALLAMMAAAGFSVCRRSRGG